MAKRPNGHQKRGLKVFVYKNLHLSKPGAIMWSLRSVDTGKVLAHTHALMMKNVTFSVNEKGRQRVLRTGNKEIHAGLEGELVIDPTVFHFYQELENEGTRVSYNPRKYNSFVVINSNEGIVPEQPVMSASVVWLNKFGMVFAAGLKGPADLPLLVEYENSTSDR